jgi:hypothetical protein
MHRVEILRLTGEPWLWNVCDWRNEWAWIAGMMIDIYGCDYCDVSIVECEDRGDVLTVAGKEVGLLPAPKRRMA